MKHELISYMSFQLEHSSSPLTLFDPGFHIIHSTMELRRGHEVCKIGDFLPNIDTVYKEKNNIHSVMEAGMIF